MKKLTYVAASTLLAAVLAMPFAAFSVAADSTAAESGLVEATVENISAYASGTAIASGTFTTGVNWAVYSDGALEITGNGAIPDFIYPEDVPWYDNINSITSIVVGEGVTSVGIGAFRNLGNAVTATLPTSLKTIGAYTFDYCEKLQTVTIQSGVTSVGEYAFGYCRSLQSITLPETVTSVGMYAFYKCTSLVSAELPSNMAGIPLGLFENCYSLKSIDWPENVVYIGESAFAGCCSLNYVNVPNTVTSIGANAFAGCEWLYSLSMDVNVTEIGTDIVSLSPYATLVVRKDSVAYNYAKDHSIKYAYFYEPYVIASGICGEDLIWDLYDTGDMYISGKGAMHDAWTNTEHPTWYDYRDEIKTVSVASGATSIASYAFYNCQNLVSIDLPSTVNALGSYAFAYCEKLKDITLPSAVTVFNEGVFLNCKSIEKLTPSSNTTSVGAYALAGCEKLTSFTMGSKVKTIGTYAFYDCKSIKQIDIAYGSSILNMSSPSIGNYAFVNCTSLEKFNISSSNWAYTTDANGALLNRSGNTLIAYPAGNKSATYTIGSSVRTINPFAFANADNLEVVTIPSKVTTIGAYAFYECDNLFAIEIPTNVTSVGDMAFYGCQMMDMAIVNSTKVTFGADAFYHTNEYFTIYGMNDSTAEAYAKKNLYSFVSLSPTDIELVDGIGKWTGGKETVVAMNDYLHFGIRATNSLQDTIKLVDSYEVGTTYKLTFKYRNNDLNASKMRMFINGVGADGTYIQLIPNLVDGGGISWQEAEYMFTPSAAGDGILFFNGEGRLSVASFDFDDIVISVVEPVKGSEYSSGDVIFSTNEADAYKPYYVDLKYVTTTGSVQREVTEYMESAADGEAEGGNLVYEMFDPIPLKAGYAYVSAKFRVSNSYTTRVLTEIKNTLNYTHKDYNGADITATIYFDNGEYVTVSVSDDATDTFDMAPYIWTEITFPFELDSAAGIEKIEFSATGYDIFLDGTVVKKLSGSPYEFDAATYTVADVQTTATSEPFDVYGLTVSGTLAGEVTKHVYADPVVKDFVFTSCLETVTYDEVIYCAVCGKELSRVAVTGEAPGHAFEDGVCTVCGEKDKTGAEIIENFEKNNLTNKTGGKATVTALADGWIVGENTFNVTCDSVCRVYVSQDGGVTYERLTATANANGGYDFTVTLTAETKIAIRLFSDLNGDGRISSTDLNMLKRILKGTYSPDEVARKLSDMNGDGRISSTDLNMLKRILKGTYNGQKW